MADLHTKHPYWERLRPYLAADYPNSTGWFDAYCPLHDDATRSAGFNFDKELWSCRKQCGGGSLRDLIRRLDARDEADFVPMKEEDANSPWIDATSAEVIDIQTRQRRGRRQNRPAPDNDTIAGWVDRLQEDEELLSKFFQRRGIAPETLREYEVGYSDEDRAYTIVVRNADGELLNVRLYRIEDEAGTTKIWSYGSEGMDANAIYPERVLRDHDTVVVIEGEWDALLSNQLGVPAVSGTTGAKQWQSKWNRKFAGKDVIVCYDRDKSGDEGTEKVVRNLRGTARSISVATLPLEWRETHGLDLTDFIHKLGHTADEWRAVLADAKVEAAPKDGAPASVSVRESFNPNLSGKPMEMTVSVVGKGTVKHLVPRSVSFSCDMNAESKCHGCPMNDANGFLTTTVPVSDPVVLKLRDVPEKQRDEALREFIGAHKCGRMETDVKDWTTTEVLVVRTSIDHAEEDDSSTASRTLVNVGQYATEANRIVRVVGTTYPSPKEQESVFQSWSLAPVESSLDTYEVAPEDVKLMERFRPARRQTALRKMGEIARDLQDNVTRVIGRLDLHIAMDLVWHSALSFDFAGETEHRGWLELLVVGDARTGKTKVADSLSRHYGFGRVVSCESASIPGLLGAVKPMPGGKGWTLEWGAIPLNDKRLVVLDEAGGLGPERIAQLSSLRSSGVAEIIKAESERTNARTRLIWLTNPWQNVAGMKKWMYGVQAIQPVIGNQEDIARFDFAMSVGTDDVPMEEINRFQATPRPHVYTSEACHALIRWVWSRRRDDVVWERGAEEQVYEEALKLGKEYVPDPPLIQGQNVRSKIARIAVAIAARTFSTDETHTKIVVTKEHVGCAVTFLDHLYGQQTFGYKEISRAARQKEREAIERMDQAMEYLHTRPGLGRFLADSGGAFRRQQMEEMLNLNREEANVIIQKLASWAMIRSQDWDYLIMPHLNTVLREMREKGQA